MIQRKLPELLATMRSEAAAGRAGKAYRAASEITFITEPDSPEHVAALDIIAKAKVRGEADVSQILAENVPLAVKQEFVRDWRGCDFINEVEVQCLATAELQIKQILSHNPVSPAHLKLYIELWNGFPVRQRAIDIFTEMASTQLAAIEAIPSIAARNNALLKFAETWNPTEASDRAIRLREELAAAELANITAIEQQGTQRSRLNQFIRDYPGTDAEQKARALLDKR